METPIQVSLNHEQYDVLDLPELFKLFTQSFHFTSNTDHLLAYQRENNQKTVTTFFDQQETLASYDRDQIDLQLNKINTEYQFSYISKKIKKKYALSEEELYEFHQVIYSSIKIIEYIDSPFLNSNELLTSWNLKKSIKKIVIELGKLVDHENQCLLLNKHPVLKPIAEQISQYEGHLRKKIKHIENSWNAEALTSQSNYDYVEEKYIIPVRSDRYNGRLGKIIFRSNTGHTLYVEPKEIEQLVNDKKSLEAQLERERYKILLAYTENLQQDVSYIDDLFHYIKRIDRINAHVRIANQFTLTRPQFTNGEIALTSSFHPLLLNPIKNNIELANHDNGLLISGPNTGGKTIMLKTIALHLLLPKFGFFVPSSEAAIPFCENFHFFANDQQSLKDGLSSFSSETKNYLTIAPSLKNNTYVFIDEIFNSTSSLEASKIAMALIKSFLVKGARLFISSHHEDLKERVFSEQNLISAHMGFEARNKTPTYRFFTGTPGHSFAIDVFKTLEKEILGSAQITIHLDKTQQNEHSEEEKLKSIHLLESKLIKMTREQDQLKQSLIQQQQSVASSISLEKEKLTLDFEAKWVELKKTVYDLTEDIKKNQRTNINRVAQALDQIKPKLASDTMAQNPTTPLRVSKNGIIEVGDHVYSETLKQHGSVIKISSDKYYIQLKKMKIWLKRSDLTAKNKPKTKQTTTTTYIKTESTSGSELLYDARGVRREDFLLEIEERIYTVINGDTPFLDIIHGHGEGILRKSLYEFLKPFKELHYDHIEGNLGTTRVTLKA
jgi:DNA mismatch repair protein MutS2